MKTSNKTRLEGLFLANFILLSLHELDAVYWREWELLLGIQDAAVGLPVFVLAHIPIYGILLFGLLRLDSRFGIRISLIFSAFLVPHFVAHAIVLAITGDFMCSALSISILLATALTAPAQLLLSIRYERQSTG